jgi:hypothetical protein
MFRIFVTHFYFLKFLFGNNFRFIKKERNAAKIKTVQIALMCPLPGSPYYEHLHLLHHFSLLPSQPPFLTPTHMHVHACIHNCTHSSDLPAMKMAFLKAKTPFPLPTSTIQLAYSSL